MKTVTIICSDPGFRRLGVRHPASETYPAERWTEAQLELLRADPMLRVIESESAGAPIPNAPLAGVGGPYDAVASAKVDDLSSAGSVRELVRELRLRSVMIGAGLIGKDEDIYRRGGEGEPEYVPLYFPGEYGFGRYDGRVAGSILTSDTARDTNGSTLRPDDFSVREPAAGQSATTTVGGVISATGGLGGGDVALRQPAAVAPGADRSDAVQDNGAGPAVNDLGAKSMGVAEAAPRQTGSGITPPIFDEARIQSIRSALKDLPADVDVANPVNVSKLKKALGFKPTAEEIAAARVETIAPEATAKT